jgi:hypothetical protein
VCLCRDILAIVKGSRKYSWLCDESVFPIPATQLFLASMVVLAFCNEYPDM